MTELVIGKNDAGQRLDKYLFRYMNAAPQSFVYRMLRKKNIVLNDKKTSGSARLKEGDRVGLYLADETIAKFRSPAGSKSAGEVIGAAGRENDGTDIPPLDIVYEDEYLIAVNKPSGVLSQKGSESDFSLADQILMYLQQKGEVTEESLAMYRPGVSNRLDRNTSGLVICGKTLPASRALNEMIRERTIGKYYRCIAAGRIAKERLLTGRLEKDEKTNTVKIINDTEDINIKTYYRPLLVGTHCTLLEVELITGKSHQIRAHLASVGHPVIGDPKYGSRMLNDMFRERYGITSQLLHAYSMVFPDDVPEPLAYMAGKEINAKEPPEFAHMTEHLCDTPSVETPNGKWTLDMFLESDLL